ncbi:MAG: hypothetical protein LBD90_05040 [Bifidobacteriaceae bacterium]|jgi:hypothetical protein|nr:hypothetical protein [Bifidobacteriaceae bacterium]
MDRPNLGHQSSGSKLPPPQGTRDAFAEEEVLGWPVEVFADRAKLTIHGAVADEAYTNLLIALASQPGVRAPRWEKVGSDITPSAAS